MSGYSPLTDTATGRVSPWNATGGAATVRDVTGRTGVTITTNTTAVTGSFTAVQVLEDATFSVFTETGSAGQAMTGFVVPAGVTLFGRITAYTLTSGKVRAYA